MNVPQYKNRVTVSAPRAARGTVAVPNPEAFDRGARQIAALGKGLVDAGETWKKGEQQIYDRIHAAEERKAAREQTKRLADAQLAWQKENDELLNGKLDENGNTVSEGLLQKKLENASSVAKDYFEKGGELVNKYAALAKTPEEEEYIRTRLSRQFQDNYDRTVRHQLREERESANMAAQAFFASSAGMAGAITRPQDMRAHLDDVYKISDDNGRGNGLNEEALKLARFELANQNMTAAVQGAVWNGNIPAARGLLTQLKSDMLPDDWNKLNWYVSHAEQAAKKDASRAGAAGSAGENVLYQRAIELMSKNPQALQTEIKGAQNDMYGFQGRLAQAGINADAKEIKNYLEWVQKALDDPDGPIGAQKRANFAAQETQYKAFDIGDEDDDYYVYNKELNTPAALAGAAATLRARMTDGAFTREDAKTAQTYLDNLRRALGTRIKSQPESSWFSTSGDEFVQKGISKLAQAPGGDEMPVEDLAGMYEDAVALARERNLNLQDPYKNVPADFDKLLTDVRVRYAAAKYGIPADVADAAVYNNRVIALSSGKNIKKPQGAFDLEHAVKLYKEKKWNGRRLQVSPDGSVYYKD